MKRIFALIMSICMLLSGLALAEESPAFTQDVVILFTSDVYCGIELGFGYAGLAAVRDKLQADGNHVVLVDNGDSIQGEPLDPDQTYTVASTNYILKNQGDGMTMFDGCTLLLDEVALDNQALINYITGALDGEIGEEYANPYGEGRIVAVEAPAD